MTTEATKSEPEIVHMIALTGLEIKHLAESAGFRCDFGEATMLDEDILEGEHTIEKAPAKGVQNDDGTIDHYDYVTRCDGCESGECTPLGNPIRDDRA